MTTTAKPPAKPADAIPENRATPKFDPLRPSMPQIPGVKHAHGPSFQGSDNTNVRRIGQIVGIAAAVFLVCGAVLVWIKSKSASTVEPSGPDSSMQESALPPPLPSAPVVPAQAGPGIAATVEELSKPWAAKEFTFVNPLTLESVGAMVIRLPGGGLWAFSKQEPYGKCELEFVTDIGRLQTQYGFRASHPMVADPCNGTVYDPLKVGPLGGNTWVRGEVVQGASLRPPVAIDVQVKGHSIIADRIE